ncbi:MAG: hypothetical protein AB1744_12480, partial [Candidatus Zixiibacteriota bacterium]
MGRHKVAPYAMRKPRESTPNKFEVATRPSIEASHSKPRESTPNKFEVATRPSIEASHSKLWGTR